LRQIREQYVQSGKVRFGYQHLPFLGPGSQWSALASECAAEQGKFWEYHDYLLANLVSEDRVAFDKNNLKKFAIDLGLGQTAFAECLESERYASTVEEDKATARSSGITGTPSFLINGQLLVGAQPFEAFQQIIEQELAQ